MLALLLVNTELLPENWDSQPVVTFRNEPEHLQTVFGYTKKYSEINQSHLYDTLVETNASDTAAHSPAWLVDVNISGSL